MLLPALQLATEKETNYTLVNLVTFPPEQIIWNVKKYVHWCLSHQYIKYAFPFYTQLLAIKNLNHTTKKQRKESFNKTDKRPNNWINGLWPENKL